jgi:hypothetical protein
MKNSDSRTKEAAAERKTTRKLCTSALHLSFSHQCSETLVKPQAAEGGSSTKRIPNIWLYTQQRSALHVQANTRQRAMPARKEERSSCHVQLTWNPANDKQPTQVHSNTMQHMLPHQHQHRLGACIKSLRLLVHALLVLRGKTLSQAHSREPRNTTECMHPMLNRGSCMLTTFNIRLHRSSRSGTLATAGLIQLPLGLGLLAGHLLCS